MADMGIYSLWPVFTALHLGVPESAEAWKTHACTIEDNVSRTIRNDFSYPTACRLQFRFAARNDMPAMDLYWYDGGMKPRLPDDVEAHDIEMEAEGTLFVGEQGIGLPMATQTLNIHRHQGLQHSRTALTLDNHLSHMRDIEQSRGLPGM